MSGKQTKIGDKKGDESQSKPPGRGAGGQTTTTTTTTTTKVGCVYVYLVSVPFITVIHMLCNVHVYCLLPGEQVQG